MGVSIEVGLVVLTLVALLFEVFTFVVKNYFLEPPESREEKRLAAEVRRLEAQKATLEGNPSVFNEFVKVGRESAACEKQITLLRNQREARKKSPNGRLAEQVQKFLVPVPIAFAYVFWVYFVSDMQAVAYVNDAGWVWPMASLLALPNQPANGSISSVGWMFLSRRVFARLLDLTLGA